MAFKFKLEKVLDYRKQLEERAMQALAAARNARDAEEARLESLKADLLANQNKMHGSVSLSGAERWLILSYIQALHADISFSRTRLCQLEEEVFRRQSELVVKAQERQLLDKLKEKRARRYAEEEKLKEQRDYDETATIRFNRQTV